MHSERLVMFYPVCVQVLTTLSNINYMPIMLAQLMHFSFVGYFQLSTLLCIIFTHKVFVLLVRSTSIDHPFIVADATNIVL